MDGNINLNPQVDIKIPSSSFAIQKGQHNFQDADDDEPDFDQQFD